MPVKDTRLQQQSKVLAGLQEVVADLIAELDLQRALQKAAKRTASLVGADIVTIHLRDPLTGETQASAGYGLKDEKTFRRQEPARGEALSLVASRDEPLIADNVSGSELAGPFTEREGVKSAAGFSLKAGDKVIGVLFVNYREPHKFEPEEIETVASFGNLAAVAMARTQTIRQFGKVSQALVDLQKSPELLQETLERIANTAIEVLGADTVDLYQYHADSDTVGLPSIIVGERLFPELKHEKVYPDDVVVKIAHSGEPVYASDAQKDPILAGKREARYKGRPKQRFVVREGIVSSAGLPLKIGEESEEEVVGVVFVGCRQERNFESDIELRERIETFANQAAVAISNARLFQELGGRAERLVRLQEVTTAISAEPSDVDKVLHLIVEGLAGIFEGISCTVRLYDSGTRRFDPQAATGRLTDFVTHDPSPGGTSYYAVETKKPRFLEGDKLRNPTDGGPAVHEDILGQGVEAAAYLPLVSGEDVVGVLYVDWMIPHRFSQNDKQTLELFANQAAIAIQNVRQRFEDIVALHEINQAITTVETETLDTVLQLVVDKLIDVVRAVSCAIRLYDPDTREYGDRITSGLLQDISYYRPRPGGASEHILQHRKPVYAEDASEVLPSGEPAIRKEFQEKGVQAIAYLPLLSEGSLIGILYTEWDSPRRFYENDRRMLELFAGLAAVATKNAQLYERVDHLANRKVRDLRAVNEVGQTLTSSIGLDEKEILILIYAQATPLMDTSDMYIALYEPDPDEPDECNPKNPEKSIIHGTVRFGLARDDGREVNTKQEEGWGPRRADDKPGLTEYVIRTRKAHRPEDVAQAYKTYATEHIGKIPRSWMGVPMMVENEVLGVVVLRNDEHENVYDADDLEVLQTIAGQSAIALQNAWLVRQLQQRIEELDTLRELAEELSAGALPGIQQGVA